MEDLDVVSRNKTTITLAEINLSLGRALAALYWYGKRPLFSNLPVHVDRSFGVQGAPPTTLILACRMFGGEVRSRRALSQKNYITCKLLAKLSSTRQSNNCE